MSSSKSPDVIICGGGAVGAAVAYYLSKLRLRVLIVESHSIARGASGFAAGIISAPGPLATGPSSALHSLSFNTHRDLASSLPEETGLDYDFVECPMLAVADTACEARALRSVGRLHLDKDGAESSMRWVDAGEVPNVCPWIDLPVSGGLLNTSSALLDPRKLTEALVAGARRLGASTKQARVTGITQSGGRVTGVELNGETVSAGSAVFAMGPWMVEASDWLGFRIPVYPLKGQILRLRIDGPLHQAGFSNGDGDYLVPKPSGLVYAGTTEENVGFDTSATVSGAAPHPGVRGPLRFKRFERGGRRADRLSPSDVSRRASYHGALAGDRGGVRGNRTRPFGHSTFDRLGPGNG